MALGPVHLPELPGELANKGRFCIESEKHEHGHGLAVSLTFMQVQVATFRENHCKPLTLVNPNETDIARTHGNSSEDVE